LAHASVAGAAGCPVTAMVASMGVSFPLRFEAVSASCPPREKAVDVTLAIQGAPFRAM